MKQKPNALFKVRYIINGRAGMWTLIWLLYQIPIMAMTSYLKRDCVKQQKFNFSSFWSSEVQKRSYWPKIQVGMKSLSMFSGRICFLVLFQVLDAICIPWLVASSSVFKASKLASPNLSDSDPSSSLFYLQGPF